MAVGILLTAAPAPVRAQGTMVSIRGTAFSINGSLTNSGTPAEGLLLNSRMVQAAFDDANLATRGRWAYPDTGVWDPERNTAEFLAALPTYAEAGLNAITVSMQGGNPVPETGSPINHLWHVSAFARDGSLKPAWVERLRSVIAAADEHGMVVILTLFYQGQDQRLRDEAAVLDAVDNSVDWLLALPHRNVLVEIANEIDHDGFDHDILSPSRVGELFHRVQIRSAGRLAVSTSFLGRSSPPSTVIRDADYVLIHSNNESPAELRSKVESIRDKPAYRADPKPIVVNEDGVDLRKLDAAMAVKASWGYYDKGLNNYRDGFQAVPVNWSINTSRKRAFFAEVRALADAGTPLEGGDQAQVLFSTVPERTDPISLAGALVSGPVYVFTVPERPVERVHWHLDDPGMTGPPYQTEYNAPYDFAGGSVATPRAFDASDLAVGPHSIGAVLVWADGEPTSITAAFSVSSGVSASVPDVVSLSAADPFSEDVGAERPTASENAHRSKEKTPIASGRGRDSRR